MLKTIAQFGWPSNSWGFSTNEKRLLKFFIVTSKFIIIDSSFLLKTLSYYRSEG